MTARLRELWNCNWGCDLASARPNHDPTCSPKLERSYARSFVAAFLAVAALAAGCGGGGSSESSGGAARPTTPARLQVLAPTPNEVTGPNVTVKLALTDAKVVPQTTGPLRPDEGHIHVSLDGQLVSMAYGTEQDLPNLAPGPHALQAEFVATDHAPFAQPVVAAVLFTVGAPGQ